MPDTAPPFSELIAALRREPGPNPLARPDGAALVWSLEPPRLVWQGANAAAIARRLADAEGRPREGVARALGLEVGAGRQARSGYRLQRTWLGGGRLGAAATIACRLIGPEHEPALLTVFPGEGSTEPVLPPVEVSASPRGAYQGETAESPATFYAIEPDETADDPPEPAADRDSRRFVFRTDEAGRFTFVSHELAEVVGAANADVLGRRWQDLTGRVVIDTGGEVDEAFDASRSWARRPILWRDRSGEAGVPGELSGSPILRTDGGLDGFRGFGVLFPGEARALRPHTFAGILPPARDAPPPGRAGPLGHALEAAAALTGSAGETMLDVLKAFFAQVGETEQAPHRDKPGRRVVEAPARPVRSDDARTPESAAALTPQEHGAFAEIARALGSGGAPADVAAAGAVDVAAAGAVDPPAASGEPAAVAPPTEETGRLLDSVPLGLAVVREGVPVFANRWLLDRLGRANLPALAEAGGLAAVSGDLLARAEAASGTPVAGEIEEPSGARYDVEARVLPVTWGGLPAAILSISPVPERGPSRRLAALEAEAAGRERLIRELSLALGLAADFAVTIDGGGRITGLSVVPAKRLGLARADVVGLPLTALIPVGDHSVASSGLEEARSAGFGTAVSRELGLMGRDGKTVPAEMRAALISEVPLSYGIVFQDLSRARALEEEARVLQSRMRRIGIEQSDFLRRVSHDLRTPLTAITGFAELMLDERIGEIQADRARGYIRDIRESGQQIGGLLDDLVDLARADSGQGELERSALDLNEVTRAALAEIGQTAAQERTIVRTSYAPAPAVVQADRATLLRAIRNVLASAISLAGAGGQLIVSTQAGRQGEIVLGIRSTGAGLSTDEIEAVMTPFRAAPAIRPSGQTGLALPLSRALVQANGGRFAITTEPGRGTLVEIRFLASVPQGAIAAE